MLWGTDCSLIHWCQDDTGMSDLIGLANRHTPRIEPYSPLFHGTPRVDNWGALTSILPGNECNEPLAREIEFIRLMS